MVQCYLVVINNEIYCCYDRCNDSMVFTLAQAGFDRIVRVFEGEPSLLA